MREYAYGKEFDVEGEFPGRREIQGYADTGVWQAEKDDACFIIIDERQFANGLDPEDEEDRKVLSRLVRVLEFVDEEERRGWLRLQLGI